MNSILNPLERNELEKAMLGRGVDYEIIQLIMQDFDARIKHMYSCIFTNTRDIGIKIEGLLIPDNCFRCFASHWYDFGGNTVGFDCKAIPNNTKIISNYEGRTKRRDDCPIKNINIKMY